MLYSLLWFLGVGVGEGQDIGSRGYALSLPSEFNRASTTIISKKCASLTCSLIFATSECQGRDLTFALLPFQSPECIASSPIRHKKEPSDWLNLTFPLRTLVYSCASGVSYVIYAITYAEWFRILLFHKIHNNNSNFTTLKLNYTKPSTVGERVG